MGKQFNRRDFLNYSLATSVVVWTGEAISRWLDEANDEGLFAIASTSAVSSPIFPQSVASGDPQPNGITLWTRIIPQPVPAKVAFQVAADPSFSQIVLTGVANTDKSRDYTTKIRLTSRVLQPFTTYYYRFIFNKTASPTGRFKTLPAPNANVEKIRFGYISCQDYTKGYYTALQHLAQEDIDFVVHLGDYIYERVGEGIRPIKLPSGHPKAQTLADYRFLYQTYRSDPNLQRLHEQFAFISIWDDHEYANDSYKQYSIDTTSETKNNTPERRQVANQAWAEYTPTSVSFNPQKNSTSSLQIYRKFTFGKLLDLVLTDERLYRDGPPCGLERRQRVLTTDCAGRNTQSRTMLGLTQRRWFLNQIRNSACVWKIWCNEVMTMQLKVLSPFATKLLGKPIPDLFLSLDIWDGYPQERALIFKALKNSGVKNLVTITGDLHNYAVGYQRINFDTPFALNTVPEDAVGVEFVGGSVTSANFAEAGNTGPGGVSLPPIEIINNILQQSNPHIQYFNSTTHGYNLVEVTSSYLTCTLKAVSNIKAPQGKLSTLKVFRVPRDRVLIEDVTNNS
jgi:alkaline phosphatase D